MFDDTILHVDLAALNGVNPDDLKEFRGRKVSGAMLDEDEEGVYIIFEEQ